MRGARITITLLGSRLRLVCLDGCRKTCKPPSPIGAASEIPICGLATTYVDIVGHADWIAEKLAEIWNGADPEPLLDRYDRQRRLTAIEYVQAQSIANKRMLEECDPAKRKANLDNLRAIAADPDKHLDFVRRSSLIAMLEKSRTIQ